jgi:hypothetical protein
MKKWTRARLKKRLKELIQTPDLVIYQRPLIGSVATSTWNRRQKELAITIFADSHQDGLVASVVHELIHIALEREMEPFTDQVEEWLVTGVEEKLYKHIHDSVSQMAWWRKHIEARIKGG